MSTSTSTKCYCGVFEDSNLRYLLTCDACQRQGRLVVPRLHDVLYYGSVIRYNVQQEGVFNTITTVTSDTRQSHIQVAKPLTAESAIWYLTCNEVQTVCMRYDAAIPAMKDLVKFIPVRDLVWMVVAEYVHGIVVFYDAGNTPVCTSNPWHNYTVHQKKTAFAHDVRTHTTAISKPLAQPVVQVDVHNDLLSLIPRTRRVSDCKASQFFSTSKPQPTLIDSSVASVKLIDDREQQKKETLALVDAAMPQMMTDWLCAEVTLDADVVDDANMVYEDSNEQPHPPTPISRPSSPVMTSLTDRDRELDAQDEAFVRFIMPRMQRIERVHAERIASINDISS